MAVYADTDILLKFAACDLLEGLLAELHVEPSDIVILESSIFKLKKDRGRRLAGRYGDAGVKRALDLMARAVPLRDVHSLEEFDKLVMVEGIDPGEAVLISATNGQTDFLLATGDKVCLRALAAADGLAATRQRLAGRIICFEEALRRVYAASGFSHCHDRVVTAVNAHGVDRYLTVVKNSDETDLHAALGSAIESLRRDTGDLLCLSPF